MSGREKSNFATKEAETFQAAWKRMELDGQKTGTKQTIPKKLEISGTKPEFQTVDVLIIMISTQGMSFGIFVLTTD